METMIVITFLAFLVSCLWQSLAFSVTQRRPLTTQLTTRTACFHPPIGVGWNSAAVRFMVTNDDSQDAEESSPTTATTRTSRKLRVRRKVTEQASSVDSTEQKSPVDSSVSTEDTTPETTMEPTIPTMELKPRPESSVTIKVQDVRDLAAGLSPSSATESPSSAPAATSSSTAKVDDSLQQLLADARQMKALDEESSSDGSQNAMGTIRNAVSTLVTIDFFVVFALLLWFLAGVFSSYVLQNDAIQIAFNNIFQPVVQPALGILMIAAIADAVFKREDQEQD